MTHDTDSTALVLLGNSPKVHPVRRKPRPVDATAEARRYVLREILAQTGLTVTELARLAGLPRPNSLYNFLGGRSLSLSSNSLAAIRAALPHIDLTRLVVGDLGAPASEPPAPLPALTYEDVPPRSQQPTDLVVGHPALRDARIACCGNPCGGWKARSRCCATWWTTSRQVPPATIEPAYHSASAFPQPPRFTPRGLLF